MAESRTIEMDREDFVTLQRLLNGAATKLRQIAMKDAERKQQELTTSGESSIKQN
jgi:hypothetical protein